MDEELRRDLELCETDVDGALMRLSGNDWLYTSCLGLFLVDPTVNELNEAIKEQAWDKAFTAAHALKGMAGNMGFIPLFHATGELVMLIRAARVKEISDAMRRVNLFYDDLVMAIKRSNVVTQ